MGDKAQTKNKRSSHQKKQDDVQQQRFRDKACLTYGDKGHFKANCPNKKMGGKRAKVICVAIAAIRPGTPIPPHENDSDDEMLRHLKEALPVESWEITMDTEVTSRVLQELYWVCGNNQHRAPDYGHKVKITGLNAHGTYNWAKERQGIVENPLWQI
ncbi:hypothetical protein DPSP01_013957 [Paraphaeosphaeria sporulosa]